VGTVKYGRVQVGKETVFAVFLLADNNWNCNPFYFTKLQPHRTMKKLQPDAETGDQG
jgi:hypothetical protein